MAVDWKDVGGWLKNNAGTGAVLVGSLLTGNIPSAVAAGVSLVSSATGEADPELALQKLQQDAGSLLQLRKLAYENEASIREHIRAQEEVRLKDLQAEHEQTQTTIRNGDNAEDEYVRHTRPKMARQSWYVTAGYVVLFEGLHLAGVFKSGAIVELAMLLLGPAAAYLGLRSWDKRTDVIGNQSNK